MINRDKLVSVIGLGYIGLPTAALLASKGYSVNGTDTNNSVVKTINQGDIHIVEPDLDLFVRKAVANGKLKAFSHVQPSDVYIICVPTPFHQKNDIPTPNVDYIVSAVDSICSHLKKGDIIILESTSPVGTTDLIRDIITKRGINESELFIAYCPERVLPGKIMTELVENARVIGGINSQSTEVVSNFYKTFVKGEILETEAKTAEMCKLTENSFRDVNIAFANELSLICDTAGVEILDLIKLANHHPRVNILHPGTGVGGHCIAVDPWFIVSQDQENAKLIKTARHVNDSKPHWVTKKIQMRADLLRTKRIACLGLTFKPDIDDLRESPAITVVNSLLEIGFEVSCVEPNIFSHENYKLVDVHEAIEKFEVIAVLVKHHEFTDNKIQEQLAKKCALDFCGVLG